MNADERRLKQKIISHKDCKGARRALYFYPVPAIWAAIAPGFICVHRRLH